MKNRKRILSLPPEEIVRRAEARLPKRYWGAQLPTMADVNQQLERITKSSWFKGRFPQVREVHARSGRETERCVVRRDKFYIFNITLPRKGRCQLQLLHAFAHCVGSRGHARVFRATYLELVEKFIGAKAAEDLKKEISTMTAVFGTPRRLGWPGIDSFFQ